MIESETQRGQRFERKVASGQESLVTVTGQPNAVYELSHEGLPEQRLQLDADAEGTVRFHVRAAMDADPLQLRLEQVEGREVVAAHSVIVSHEPGHWNPINARSRTGRVRPALTDDQAHLSNAELVQLGFPPRPAPSAAPSRHARWQRLVSEPYAVTDSARTDHARVRFGRTAGQSVMSPTLPLPPPSERERLVEALAALALPRQVEDSMFNGSFTTWAGAYLTRPTGEFFLIQADWAVPRVFGGPASPNYSAAAKWIGLGNAGNDLFQSGTDSECVVLFGGQWVITNYWMWIEALPAVPWAVSNFPVSPGDQVSVDIFVADQNGTDWFAQGSGGGLTSRDNSVWFMLYNTTQHASYWGTLPVNSSIFSFNGNTAEFIIERPTDLDSGNAYPLANFCATTIRNCAYGDAWYGNREYFALEPDDGSQPFDGTLSYLNMVNPSTGHRLATALSGTDPAGFGGEELICVWNQYS
jgi:hypothetical protein